jgi:apolipoprotein N-acyltransferase
MWASLQRKWSSLRRSDPLPYAGLLWLGTLSGLGRGLAWPWLPLFGLFAMFVLVLRARSALRAAGLAVAFGFGEAGVCFLGSISWGNEVPLALTVMCVATHHLPLAVWAGWPRRALRGHWRWIGTIGFSATINSFAELLGIPSREAVVLVTSVPELVTGARLFGSDLITAVIEATLLLAAAAFVEAGPEQPWLSRARQASRVVAFGLLLLLSSAALARFTSAAPLGALRVGIPQINADSLYYKSRLLVPELARGFEHQFDALGRALGRAELVVATEGFDGGFGLMLPSVREAWGERARARKQSWLMTSYIIKPDGRKSNAAGGFSADGHFVGVHEKVDLAPFGERDLAPGRDFRPLSLGRDLRLGVLICQESYLQRGAKALALAGATLLTTTTSDVTFGSSTTVIEHLAMARLRAIETGRSMIWASNAGPSGVIDRFGRFEAGPFRVPAGVEGDASLHAELTPFVRYAPLWLSCGPVLLLIALTTVRRRGERKALAPIDLPPPRLGWLRVALAVGCAAASAATAVGTSAAVEARWGLPERAWAAIPDLFAAPATLATPNAYARFLRPPGRSFEGALAYLGEYYGLAHDSSRALRTLPDTPSLDTIAGFLSARYGLASRRVELKGPLPLTPLLLRSRDGAFAVVDYAGSGHGGLIDFATGQSRTISASELAALPGVEGLFPFAKP